MNLSEEAVDDVGHPCDDMPGCNKTCFRVCLNLTTTVPCGYVYEGRVQKMDVVLGCLILPVMLVTVVISCLFLSIMRRLHTKRISSHVFMLSLVCADLLCALFCMPISLSILFNSRVLENAFAHYLQGTLMITLRQAIMFTILTMVIDKMTAVSKPLHYKQIFTYRVAVLLMVVVWSVSFLTNLVVIFDHAAGGVLGQVPLFIYTEKSMFIYAYWNTQHLPINKYGSVIFAPIFVSVTATSAVLCVVLWIKVAYRDKKKKFDNRVFKKATVTTVLITVTFLFTYSTRYSISISQAICLTCQSRHMIASVGTSIIFTGCLIDPVILLLRSSNIRKELSAMVVSVTNGKLDHSGNVGIPTVGLENQKSEMVISNRVVLEPIQGGLSSVDQTTDIPGDRIIHQCGLENNRGGTSPAAARGRGSKYTCS